MIAPDQVLRRLSPEELQRLKEEIERYGEAAVRAALPRMPSCAGNSALAVRLPWASCESSEGPNLLQCVEPAHQIRESQRSQREFYVSLFQIASCCQLITGACYACIAANIPPLAPQLNEMHLACAMNELWYQHVRKGLSANSPSELLPVLQAQVDNLHQNAQLRLTFDDKTSAALQSTINQRSYQQMFTAMSLILDAIISERAQHSLRQKHQELDARVDGRLKDASVAEAHAQRSNTQGIRVLLILNEPNGHSHKLVLRQNYAITGVSQ
jgi:hypothetical protein